jgi:cytochrome b subunit of formate dehydrogenase
MTDNKMTPYQPKLNRTLKAISRASAWALLVGVGVLIISGWGITQTGVIHSITFSLIDRRIADAIHRDTNVPLTVFFLMHVLTNIKIGLSRSRPSRQWLINGILILVGLALLAIMVYMEFFRLGG